MKLTSNEDCGNAPRKQFVLDFNIAFAKNDVDGVIERFSEDAVWEIVGVKKVAGRSAIRKELETLDFGEAQELRIRNILSHGKLCAANGEMMYDNVTIAFCDVYTFSSHSKDAKIARLESYGIEIK